MKKSEAIKKYFSVPDKPVTNTELLQLAKADMQGYKELGDACLEALGEKPDADDKT